MVRTTYVPRPGVNGHTHRPPRPLAVYPSSIGSAVTFALDVDGTGMHREGLRLDLEQVTTLRDQLTAWIKAVSA